MLLLLIPRAPAAADAAGVADAAAAVLLLPRLLRLLPLLQLLFLLLPLMLQSPTPALFLLLMLLLDLQSSFLERQFPRHPQNGHLQENSFFQDPCQGAGGHEFFCGRVCGVAAE